MSSQEENDTEAKTHVIVVNMSDINKVKNSRQSLTVSEKIKVDDYTFTVSFNVCMRDSPFSVQVSCDKKFYGKIFIETSTAGVITNSDGQLNPNTKKPFRHTPTYKSVFSKNTDVLVTFAFTPKQQPTSGIINKGIQDRNKAPRPYTRAASSYVYTYYPTTIKRSSDYSGLDNNSSLCYLNTVIQSLFHIPLFRRIIFSIDVPRESRLNGIIVNLQALFYRMQKSKTSCSTSNLIKSFGWTANDLHQQDIHEFFTVFFEKILEKTQNSNQHDQLIELFQIKVQKILENKQRHYRKELIVDEFYILNFPALTGNTIQDKIDEPVREVIKDHEIGDKSKIDCEIIEIFVKLPPILFISVNRYQNVNGSTNKITNNITYNAEIEIPFNNQRIKYSLHAILLHHGNSPVSGHYTTVIRPKLENKWYYFNDSTVENIDENAAFSYKDSCYLFVYIRKDEEEDIYINVSEEDAPEYIRTDSDNTISETIPIFSDKQLLENAENLTNNFRNLEKESSIEVTKSDSNKEIYNKVKELDTDEQLDKFTLWILYGDLPGEVIPNTDITKGLNYWRNKVIFLQNGEHAPDNVLVFIKLFDFRNGVLLFLGTQDIPKSTKASDLFSFVSKMIQLQDNQQYNVFLEFQNSISVINTSVPLSDANNFHNGATLIFQEIVNNETPQFQVALKEACSRYSAEIINQIDVLSYYEQYNNGSYDTFMEMMNHSVIALLYFDQTPSFLLQYPSKWTKNDLVSYIAELSGFPIEDQSSSFVLFLERNDHRYELVQFDDTSDASQPLHEIPYIKWKEVSFFPRYKIFSIALSDIPKKDIKNYRFFVVYTSDDNYLISQINFIPILNDSSKTISELPELRDNLSQNSRISLMRNGRIHKLISPETKLGEVGEDIIRIDLNQNPDRSTKFIVVQTSAEIQNLHPNFVSFLLPIESNEKFSETKKRILERLHNEINESDFSKYEFSYRGSKSRTLSNNDILSNIINNNDNNDILSEYIYISIYHKPQATQSIKIYN